MMLRILAVFTLLLALNTTANEFAPAIEKHAKGEVISWLDEPIIIDSVKAQNKAHARTVQSEIDKLDKQWRAETSAASQPLIDKVLGNALSQFLKQKQKASSGLYTEIFIMDDKGLNVGQSAVTSDYWQGDEAKWQETFKVGPDAIHISEVEEDESTQTYQSQLSLSIKDPETGTAIGAITIGINLESL